MSPVDILSAVLALAALAALVWQHFVFRRDAERAKGDMERVLEFHAATVRDMLDRFEGMQAASTEAIERVTMRMADVVHEAPVGGLPRDLWMKQHELEQVKVAAMAADQQVRHELLRKARVR